MMQTLPVAFVWPSESTRFLIKVQIPSLQKLVSPDDRSVLSIRLPNRSYGDAAQPLIVLTRASILLTPLRSIEVRDAGRQKLDPAHQFRCRTSRSRGLARHRPAGVKISRFQPRTSK